MSQDQATRGGIAGSLAQIYADFLDWIIHEGPWWSGSILAHIALLTTCLMLIRQVQPKVEGDAPSFAAATLDTEVPATELTKDFEVGETPIEPTVLNTETLTLVDPPTVDEQMNTSPDDPFSEAGGGAANSTTDFGGLSGFDVASMSAGPKLSGEGGLSGKGAGANAGSGGAGVGFGGRGTGQRKGMIGGGGTKPTERAVAAALNWLARHQNPDGSWSLEHYDRNCKDKTCVGEGKAHADTGATALALLPFLAAGQTHKAKGPYQHTLQNGIQWLLTHQDPKDRSFRFESVGPGGMYSHAIATICLCEAYGLTNDSQIGIAAQRAISFIESAQNQEDGGWRYRPQESPGDTSVTGWYVMALKSGHMAGLDVTPETLAGAKKYLRAAKGNRNGLFVYLPGRNVTAPMTAVGLLCSQYLGTPRDDESLREGMTYLMKHLPSEQRDVYYWYYATQVLHNLPGPEWDSWNRTMRKVLIDSQSREGCAKGSWDPAGFGITGDAGGRITITSMCCLTLEVYYRYLPLYKLDRELEESKKE